MSRYATACSQNSTGLDYDCMGHLAEAGGSDDASLGLWSGGLFYAVPEMGESLDGDDA